MKIVEILELKLIYNRLKNQKLSFKLAYKLNKMDKAIQPEIDFYNTSLKNIIEDCAVKADDGGYVFLDAAKTKLLIKEDKLDECAQKLRELLDIDIQITPMLELSDFELLGDFTAREVELLSPFIID